MNIALPPDLEKYVRDKVRAGAFTSPDDVIRAALDTLRSQEELTSDDVSELRKLIAVGLEESKKGLSRPWNAEQIKATLRRQCQQ
jgi:antitoxin ParD1/3/4